MSIERNEFYRITLTLGIGAILVVSLMYVSIPLISVWGHEFHATSERAAWAGSTFGFAYAVGNVIFGICSDRFRKKTIMGIGLALLALISLAVGWSPSLTWLMVWRSIQGFVAASFPPVALAYVGDVLSPRYRPIAVSILSSSFLLSGICGQLYAQTIEGWLGWSGVFVYLAVGYIVLSYFVYRLPAGVLPPTDHSLGRVVVRTTKLVSSPVLLLSFGISATILFSFVTMYSGLGAYVSDRFGILDKELLLIRIAGIPGILMSLAAGPLINRFEAKRLFIAGLAVAGMGLGAEALAESLVILIAAIIIFMAGISIANPSMIVVIGQLAGTSRGSAFALNACSLFIGASFGPILAEYIHSFSVLCFVIISVLFIAAIIAGIIIPNQLSVMAEGKITR